MTDLMAATQPWIPPWPGAIQCPATAKSTGVQCTRTAIKGGKTCRYHGSGTAKARAAAARRVAEDKARHELGVLGEPTSVDPGKALLDLISWKHAEVVALRSRVGVLSDAELVWGTTSEVVKSATEFPGTDTTASAEANVWWRLLRQAEDQLASYAAAAHRAGIAEREVRLAEQQGELVAGVIRRILGRLDLTPEQVVLVGTVVPAELRALAATP